MSIRADERNQLQELLRRTLDANGGNLPASVRRSTCRAFDISPRSLARQIAAARATSNTGTNGTNVGAGGSAGVAAVAPPRAGCWWEDPDMLRHVVTTVAGADTVKQAWSRLAGDGTVTAGYPQFTRQLSRYLEPAVHAGVTGNGREDYLKASLYCSDTVPDRNLRWQADAQEIPVYVSGDRGEPAFKPWQTTFIDDATRMVIATVITAGRPTAADVIACLAAAIRGFTTPDGTYVGGIPDTIRWDNGAEFLADIVTAACARLGIGARPAAPYASWQKGKIERWHQTSQRELFSTLVGASGGPHSFTGRPLWRTDGDLLSLSALTLAALDWVQTYNYDRVHSVLGSTPLQAWASDIAPLTFAAPADLHPMMLTLPRQRVVGKDGVSYRNIKFQSPGLRSHRGSKVTLRVLPHDYTHIAVFDGDTFLCDAVPAAQLSPDQRRQLVQQRHADYQQMKDAYKLAAARRAQDAVIAGLTTPSPPTARKPARPLRDTELLPSDEDLLALSLDLNPDSGEPF